MTQSSSELASGVKEGDLLAGKYRVERILGSGGMGVVVAAHDEMLDRKVALKFLLAEVLDNAEAVTRFRREAQAAVKIKSEHVAAVYEVGTLENGAPFIVMEYLEGGDLSGWLEQKGVLPIEQAVEFILQACEAIAEAHGLGIVHRDLKPANLFWIRRADGLLSVKVLDFGISKLTGPQTTGTNADVTHTSTVMGSPHYMSPEQLRSARDVDARTDIWALGVILFQLLTRRPPFDCEAIAELFVKIMTNPTPRVRELRADVPEVLEQVICKCLEKDREQRYPNVAELALALAPAAPKRARASVDRIRRIIQNYGLATQMLSMPPSLGPRAVQTDIAWGHSAAPPARNTKRIILGISLVVAALGIAALVVSLVNHSANGTTHAVAVAALPLAAHPSSSQLPAASAEPTLTLPAASPGLDAGVASAPELGVSSGATTKSETLQRVAPHVRAVATSHSGATHTAEPSAAAGPALAEAASLATPNCAPNFTLDSEGRKHFKPECFK